MNLNTLLLRSLAYYKRTNLAVILGAAVGTSVLAGALIVGDSVRWSLRELTLDRLGRVDIAIVGDRFMGEPLADRLAVSTTRPAPAILLRGAVSHAETRSRATKVNVIGVDERFWHLGRYLPEKLPGRREVILNEPLANEIGAGLGDYVLLRVEKQSSVPRDSTLGRKTDTVSALRRKVVAIVPAEGFGRFGLQPTQHLPLNAYLQLAPFQSAIGQPGKANAVLLPNPDKKELNVKENLRIEDYGIRVRQGEGYVSVESDRMILEPALERLVNGLKLQNKVVPVFSYLANTIRLAARKGETQAKTTASNLIPYSLVAALPEDVLKSRLRFSAGPTNETDDDAIILNTWAADDLGVKLGDEIEISYYMSGPNNELVSKSTSLKLAGIVSMEGLGRDRNLTPEYPGIHEARTMADWNPPFPVHLKSIRPNDEKYWEEYRATPKAFVSLETGQKLWSSRFGRLTAIRLYAPGGPQADDVESAILQNADPEVFGISTIPVKQLGLAASSGATDFGGLFVGFSIFLITSAAVLVSLLFRLGIEQRAREVGLLLASGFTSKIVQRQLLKEGSLLAGIGGCIGLAGAIGYGWLMLEGLRTWWVDAIGTPFLKLHVSPIWLVSGFVGSFLIVLFSIWWTVRRLSKSSSRNLLAGSGGQMEAAGKGRGVKTGAACIVLAGLLTGAGAGGVLTDAVIKVGGKEMSLPLSALAFFSSGSLLLAGALSLLSTWMRRETAPRPAGRGVAGLVQLGARNGSRSPDRSILTASLVACATFMIVAVAAFRHDPSHVEPDFRSGDGGFALLAESDLPIYQSLDSEGGRSKVGLADAEKILSDISIYPLRHRSGEDASCLNLYKPQKPEILGAIQELIERGGFKFQSTLAYAGENPWVLLNEDLEPGVVPVFGDFNTVMWILHLGLGKEMDVRAENGEMVKARIVGMFMESIFQSELVMSESNFLKLFPSEGGYRTFLIETPFARMTEVSNALEGGLADYGFDAVSTGKKLADYLVVQNTYLSTFMTLGGLGLVLGTFGLGTVLLRNVLERKAELAMLRALGFRTGQLAIVVLAENGFLLVVGLLVGTVSALLAVAPHLIGGGSDVPWASLLGMLGLVFITGMLSGTAAVIATIRSPIISSLRGE
ncbi:MAG: FtsX-like permease family protein [Planctomycetota bacterium]|nr:FtsX-like permease family protein [Planctomycetota bacterium]